MDKRFDLIHEPCISTEVEAEMKLKCFAFSHLQCTSKGVEETSFPRCLLVRVVDCLMGEKCLVVDGV